jgi:hypothetical protein
LSTRASEQADLVHHLHLLAVIEVDDFHRIGQARHQHEPWIVCIVHQQHARQRQVADFGGILDELGMEGPRRFGGHRESPELKLVRENDTRR